MAIFNSYVKLPEGIWLSYWCVLRREWMVENGVAGIMTLLVMKWIIPENSLCLAPVSINPFFFGRWWGVFHVESFSGPPCTDLACRNHWGGGENGGKPRCRSLPFFWGQVEGKFAGSSIIRWFWMGKASMKDCWYTHTHIYTYGLHMGSFWFLLLSVLLKQLHIIYLYIHWMISRSMMEFVVSIAVWLRLTVPSLSAVLSDPALALAGRDPVLWAMCHREISRLDISRCNSIDELQHFTLHLCFEHDWAGSFTNRPPNTPSVWVATSDFQWTLLRLPILCLGMPDGCSAPLVVPSAWQYFFPRRSCHVVSRAMTRQASKGSNASGGSKGSRGPWEAPNGRPNGDDW